MKKAFLCAALILAAAVGACSQPADTPAPDTSVSQETAAVTETAAAETTTTTAAETEPPETEPPVKRIEYTVDTSKPLIALTFDDGPNTTTTVEVLDMLEKYQVPGSFFLIGTNINSETEKVVKRAYDLGCEINNHSKTHSYMNEMEAEDIAAEVKFVSDKVKEITGEETKFFRPPYIAVNDTMYENIDMPFICGVGCNDWNQEMPTEKRIKSILKQASDGTIVLLHDAAGNSKTVEALDTIIPSLLEEGYQFVTVSEMFEAKGVEIRADDNNLYSVLN